jgi:hypothetical protein
MSRGRLDPPGPVRLDQPDQQALRALLVLQALRRVQALQVLLGPRPVQLDRLDLLGRSVPPVRSE